MLKILYSKKTGAISGVAAAITALVTVAAAIAALCSAKITAPKNIAVIMTDGVSETVYTRAENIDDFIAEQRTKLHPFDVITYAALGKNGVFEMSVDPAPRIVIHDGENDKEVRAIRGEALSSVISRSGMEFTNPVAFFIPFLLFGY